MIHTYCKVKLFRKRPSLHCGATAFGEVESVCLNAGLVVTLADLLDWGGIRRRGRKGSSRRLLP